MKIKQINEIINHLNKLLNICIEYKKIIQSKNCETCHNRFCDWKTKDIIRYNCPHYDGKENKCVSQ